MQMLLSFLPSERFYNLFCLTYNFLHGPILDYVIFFRKTGNNGSTQTSKSCLQVVCMLWNLTVTRKIEKIQLTPELFIKFIKHKCREMQVAKMMES